LLTYWGLSPIQLQVAVSSRKPDFSLAFGICSGILQLWDSSS
jgi:hypothetical protein